MTTNENPLGTGEPAPPERGGKAYFAGFDVVSRNLALAVATVYVSGLLITTLYHVRLNISDFSFVRPKVLVVGTIFLLLTGIPAASAVRIESLLHKAPIENPELRTVLRWLSICGFCSGCVDLSLGVSLLFGDLRHVEPVGVVAFLLWHVFGALTSRTVVKEFLLAPKRCLLVAALTVVLLWVIVFQYFGFVFCTRAIWFVIAGLLGLWSYHVMHDPRWRANAEWEKIIIPTMFILMFFAIEIYGDIGSAWGGGKPTPVTIYESPRTAHSNSGGERYLLLDETENGYYVRRRVDADTVFIRRDVVSEVRYNQSRQSGWRRGF